MRWIDVLRLRLRSLFARASADDELARELRFHLDSRIDELVAAGATLQAAREAALREFGSPASVTQQCRDTRRVNFISNLLQDARYGARIIAAQPMLLVAATTSIALGVGANLAIFGLANDLLLATPTATNPHELVHIRTDNGSHTSYTAWRDLEAADAIAGLAGHDLASDVIWRGRDDSLTLTPLLVTANFFEVVGVPVALGRPFGATEAGADRAPRLAVLSDGFWRRRLGGDPAVIGESITLNGAPYTVLGVLPPNLRSLPGYGIVPDVYLPLSRELVPDLDRPQGGHLQLIGRLRPDQTAGSARAALGTVAARFGAVHDDPGQGRIRDVTPVGGVGQLREFKEIALFFGVLLIVTGLVLAIACANVAGLLLARGAARRKEIALRLAIGASRGRLVQQLLTEGFLLAALGTAAGLAMTIVAGRLLAQWPLPLPIPLELHLSFDTRIIWLASALVIASTVLCGLAPALQATRPALVPALKLETPAYGHRRMTVREWLVAGQVAVSVLLLVMTALFLRNLGLAHDMAPEFDAASGVVAQVAFVEGRQGSAAAPTVVTVIERVRLLPAVEAASFAAGMPLTMRYGGSTGTDMRIEGREQPVRAEFSTNSVGPGYFEAMGLPLLRGRDFAPSDRAGAPAVVIVNQEFVRRYFDGLDPLGRHIFLPGLKEPIPAMVVGVARDSKYRSIGEDREAAVYDAYLQRRGAQRLVHVVARTRVPPETMLGTIENAVRDVDGSAAIHAEPMTSAIAFALLPSRIGAALVGALGVLGAMLAMVGLYGVVSFAVSRRTNEIGVRMALGASRNAVIRLVLREATLLVGAGVLVGLGIALVATTPLRFFLVTGLKTTDPLSFAVTALLLVLTSLAATWGPARRAARVEPATALRAE